VREQACGQSGDARLKEPAGRDANGGIGERAQNCLGDERWRWRGRHLAFDHLPAATDEALVTAYVFSAAHRVVERSGDVTGLYLDDAHAGSRQLDCERGAERAQRALCRAIWSHERNRQPRGERCNVHNDTRAPSAHRRQGATNERERTEDKRLELPPHFFLEHMFERSENAVTSVVDHGIERSRLLDRRVVSGADRRRPVQIHFHGMQSRQ